jgi:hypothetical protein
MPDQLSIDQSNCPGSVSCIHPLPYGHHSLTPPHYTLSEYSLLHTVINENDAAVQLQLQGRK